MKRSYWITLAAIVAVVIVVLVVRSRGQNAAPRYRTAEVQRGPIEVLVSATGTINPVEQVNIGSQVSGTVRAVRADYNDRVTRGQVLCQIDPASFRARTAQAEATVARADAALKDAQRQQRRAQELAAQDYVSKAEVEAQDLAVAQRQAELRLARAQLDQSRIDLANTTIRSPIDGVVIARSVDVGQTVAASLQAPQLFVIANDLTRMQVETRIDEADIGSIHPGLPVRFTVDAFPDLTFQGQVAQVRLEPVTVQNVVTYATIIGASNPDMRLKPGMTANVSVLVDHLEDVLKVPNAALRFRPQTGGSGARGAGGGAGAAGASTLGAGANARTGAKFGSGAQGSGFGARGGGSADSGGGGGRVGTTLAARGAARGDSTRRGPGRGGASMTFGAGRRSRTGVLANPGESASGGGDGMLPHGLRPGAVYALRANAPARVSVLSGATDGAFTQVEADSLHEGDLVIVGLEQSQRGSTLQPPPGLGGGGGGGRGR